MKNPIINSSLENSIKDLKSIDNEENQMELSVCIANFFGPKDIIELSEEALSLNVSTKKRDINKECVTLHKYTNENGEEFEICDILLLNNYPPVRFIEIIFRISCILDYTRMKYRYYPDIYSALNKILADAYNYKLYCNNHFDMDKCTVVKKFLYINFAKKVIEILGNNYKVIIDFKYIMNMLVDKHLFEKKDRFLKIYDITDYIHIELISITNHIAKLSVYNNSDKVYIYLDRHLKGMGQLKLILELILKKRIYL